MKPTEQTIEIVNKLLEKGLSINLENVLKEASISNLTKHEETEWGKQIRAWHQCYGQLAMLKPLEERCLTEGWGTLKGTLIYLGYTHFSYRISSRPSSGSPCHKIHVLDSALKIPFKISTPEKSVLSNDPTVVVKTMNTYLEFWHFSTNTTNNNP